MTIGGALSELNNLLKADDIPFYYKPSIKAVMDTITLIKPQEPKWIPVSERLPEESLNSVIGWDACRERCVFVQYWEGHFQITGKPESFDITAWMPLPTPYKPQESEVRNEQSL